MASLALRSRTDALGRLRSEFRPLDSIQPTFSLVSPPYRGNTVSYDGESASGLFGFLFGCVLVGLFGLLCFGVFFWCFIPHHHAVFPFLSTMTWAPRPHGVRTRGNFGALVNSSLTLVLVASVKTASWTPPEVQIHSERLGKSCVAPSKRCAQNCAKLRRHWGL